MKLLPALALLLVGCTGGAEGPRLVDAVVAFPPRDTIQFSLPAKMHRCSGGRAVLVEAVSPEGSGILVLLHYRDSLVPGSYRIVMPADTTAPSAVVTVRYLLRDVGHAFFFDSGAVLVRGERGGKIGGRIQGSGIESGIRTPTRIDYHDVPLPETRDSVLCAFQP